MESLAGGLDADLGSDVVELVVVVEQAPMTGRMSGVVLPGTVATSEG